MADIKKELNDIKNAVYGREVRSSIHDGIKKINEESEESRQKAEEAHEITQDLLDETFDSAALEANFEQRLNDEIANLQPEWTQFKNDTVSQLAQMTRQVNVNTERISQLQIEKVDQTYFEDSLKQIGNMTPKEAFATLQDLENAYPDGNEGIFLVQENGHWYFWNGTEWVDGGLYQALPWTEFMYEQDEEWI